MIVPVPDSNEWVQIPHGGVFNVYIGTIYINAYIKYVCHLTQNSSYLNENQRT